MRIGNLLMAAGALLLIAGLVVRFLPGAFAWFGHLPGDIRVEGERTRFFAPITSMLVVSLVASVLVNLIARLFRGE